MSSQKIFIKNKFYPSKIYLQELSEDEIAHAHAYAHIRITYIQHRFEVIKCYRSDESYSLP